jgi:hypothetical protein
VTRIDFDYAGGEAPAASEILDDQDDPAVRISISRHTRKIIILEVSHPVDAAGLRQIGERLATQAANASPQAKRFSFLMIARILIKWAVLIASGAETKAKFFGGQYDGLQLDHNEINAHCKFTSIPTSKGLMQFLLMPPLTEWEGIVSRSPSRKSDAGNVYPYERVMTESGVEYHDASTNGRFQQAVNDMRQ